MSQTAYSAAPATSPRSTSFAEEVCLPFLLHARNADGGWGYMPGSPSAVEPTCWALSALGRTAALPEAETAVNSVFDDGIAWLLAMQLADGSWPAFRGQPEGCWVTALACRVLESGSASAAARERGVRWLCDTWPADGKFWRRWLQRGSRKITRQDSSLSGWSWTPGTASWVEPTAYVLALLKNLPGGELSASARKRMRLAEAMLYDRVCPGGGWNAGNPLVYNVAGIPRVAPTVWALLALAGQSVAGRRPSTVGQESTINVQPPAAAVQQSLDWLAGTYANIRGPGSLALAHIGLSVYGRSTPPLEPQLRSYWSTNNFLNNVAVISWAVIALRPTGDRAINNPAAF